jgi:hypothetical protein
VFHSKTDSPGIKAEREGLVTRYLSAALFQPPSTVVSHEAVVKLFGLKTLAAKLKAAGITPGVASEPLEFLAASDGSETPEDGAPSAAAGPREESDPVDDGPAAPATASAAKKGPVATASAVKQAKTATVAPPPAPAAAGRAKPAPVSSVKAAPTAAPVGGRKPLPVPVAKKAPAGRAPPAAVKLTSGAPASKVLLR